MPAGPSSPGAGAGAGSLPTTLRGPSAKSLMKLPWSYPVYTAPKVEADGRSVAAKARRALSRADALAYIAGDDPRPLLVLRECKTCNGTDDALLGRGNADNERTFLLARWFHCVKLPVDVIQEDHPFHELFDAADPEHMFMGTVDGSVHAALESERSRVELWDTMIAVLKASYAKGPELIVRNMQRSIDSLDLLDQRLQSIEATIDQILETDGPDSKKLKKAQAELVTARKERDLLLQGIDQATAELKLKKPAEEAAPAAAKRS